LQHLRSHRQLITCDQDLIDLTHERYSISAKKWLIESPYIVLELLNAGIGWAYLHEAVVRDHLDKGDLIKLDIQFIENDTLQGLDIVWTNNRSFGKAGQWLLDRLLDLY
jgi:DNA-binding transcriptional LysR family regulator